MRIQLFFTNYIIIKYLLITSFLILLPYISLHGQETDSLEIKKERFTTVDFKYGLLSYLAINSEMMLKARGRSATLLNFGPSYIAAIVPHAGGFKVVHGPGIHTTGTLLWGRKPYRLRDTHFEFNAGLVFGLAFHQPSIAHEYGKFFIYPRTNLGFRYQSPTSDRIFRFYIGFVSIGFSIGFK